MDLNLMKLRSTKVLRTEAIEFLTGNEEFTSRMLSSYQELIALGHQLDVTEFKECLTNGLSDAIDEVVIMAFRKGYTGMIPLQEAMSMVTGFEPEVVADALCTVFNQRPKKGAWLGRVVHVKEDIGTVIYLKSLKQWDTLTQFDRVSRKVGMSNTPWVHSKNQAVNLEGDEAVNYKSIGGSHANKQGANYDTLPFDTWDILGHVPYSIVEWEVPKFTRSLSDKELVSTDAKNRALYNIELEGKCKEIDIATFGDGDFYFAHNGDYRLRSYVHGSTISPQGCDWDKGILEFGNKKTLTKEGFTELRISIINALGMDKITYFAREYKFFELYESGQLHTWAGMILKGITPSDVDEPHVFFNLMNQYERARKGLPVGAICHRDGTASGAQILSACTYDVAGMVGSNVISLEEEKRHDPYTELYDTAKPYLPKGTHINRTDMKKVATMPALYGGIAGVDKLFGEYANVFWAALNHCQEGAYWFLTKVRNAWGKRTSASFTLPDGVVVNVNSTKIVKKRITVRGIGKIVLAEEVVSAPVGKAPFIKHLSAIVHALDGWVLRHVIDVCNAQGVDIQVIHDSFGCHPNDVPVMRDAYNQALAYLVQEDYLRKILIEMFGEDFGMNQVDQDVRDEIVGHILESKYSLT